MRTKTTYTVMAMAHHGRYSVIDCGHKHRTITGAARCFASLTRRTDQGRAAAWYHAVVRHTDESELTPDESVELRDALYDIEGVLA